MHRNYCITVVWIEHASLHVINDKFYKVQYFEDKMQIFPGNANYNWSGTYCGIIRSPLEVKVDFKSNQISKSFSGPSKKPTSFEENLFNSRAITTSWDIMALKSRQSLYNKYQKTSNMLEQVSSAIDPTNAS